VLMVCQGGLQKWWRLVSAQQPRTQFPVGPLQLFFKEDTDEERPDDEAHNTKPRTDRVPHGSYSLLIIWTNGDSEFIEDPMKKRGRE